MVKVSELLTSIRSDIASKRFKAIDLAREAGIAPTSLYTMLDPEWSNSTIANAEAIAAAYERITKTVSPAPSRAPA